MDSHPEVLSSTPPSDTFRIFNVLSKMMTTELKYLSRFTAWGVCINKIRYREWHSVDGLRRQTTTNLEMTLDESKKKGLTRNYKKTRCIAVTEASKGMSFKFVTSDSNR